MTLTVQIKNLTIGDQEPVRLMATFNLSQESFYKGSVVTFNNTDQLTKRITTLLDQGTEIFDLGPKSSAPTDIYGNETAISEQEEINRIKPALNMIRDLDQKVLISIDTQSSLVAEYALSHGADIINDISGLKFDNKLAKVVGDHAAFAILMACEKQPGDVYEKQSVITALQSSFKLAQEYIPHNHLIIDPGIGGWVPHRTPEHDFQLILDTPAIKEQLSSPALLALSRKSFIGKTLNLPPNERLAGSLSATAIGVLHGANIIRTHDIKETKEAIIIAEKFKKIVFH